MIAQESGFKTDGIVDVQKFSNFLYSVCVCFQRRYRFESGDIANAPEKEETLVVNEEVIE